MGESSGKRCVGGYEGTLCGELGLKRQILLEPKTRLTRGISKGRELRTEFMWSYGAVPLHLSVERIDICSDTHRKALEK